MTPKLTVLDTQEGINELVGYIEQFEYVGYDTETTGLDSSSQVIGLSVCGEEDKAFYVILQKWDNVSGSLVNLGLDVSRLHELLLKKHLIMHNGVFDSMVTQSNFKVNLIKGLHTDTMVLAHLLNENRRIGLKDLGRVYFGEDSGEEQALMRQSVLANGGKLTQDCYEMYKADPYLMGTYGAKDALLTYKLFLRLIPELCDQGLDDFFYGESMPLLRGPTYQLNTVGLKIDVPYLMALKKTLEIECLEAKAFISAEIQSKIQDKYPGTKKSNTFNIASNQQLSWLMFGVLGLEFGNLTKEGKRVAKDLGVKGPYRFADKKHFISECSRQKDGVYQPESIINGKKVRGKKFKEPWAYIAADKKILEKYAPKIKWVQRLLELKQKTKILETYVIGIENRLRYGIINPGFRQTGTTSGRYSSSNPNFQNLPRKDKRVKKCVIPRPGKVFVGADYSQLEPRVFAYYSKDENLLNAFSGTDDFYSVIGMRVYDKTDCTPQKEGSPDAFGIKYPHLRDLSKVIALASTYGATSFQLMKTTGKSEQDTQADIDKYFEEFPGVKSMMLGSHATAKKTGQVVNLFGRPRRLPEAMKIDQIYGDQPHRDLPYEARTLLNLAVNHVIQGTAASIVNRAAIAFHEECLKSGIDCNLVVQVHDSLVVECNEEDAETVSLILRNAMENTVKLDGINLEAIPKIGRNLAEV